MSENNRNLNKDYSSDNDPSEVSGLAAQLQKIQTHLGFLEKKLDLLLAQQPQGGRSGGGFRPRPSGGGRDFPPRRPFRGGGNDFRSREDRPPMREGRPPMREGRGGEDRPREFRGGHGGGHGGGFKKRPRHF